MSLSHETLLELMSLADGELDEPDRERVERLVASDAEARQVVESLRGRHVDGWLAETTDQRAARAGADGIADAVIALASGASSGRSAQGGLVSIGRRSGGRSARLPAIAAAAGALALAAAAVLYLHGGTAPPDLRVPVASVRAPPAGVEATATAVAVEVPAAGVEVDEIDAPSRGVSLFEIPIGAAAAAKPSGASSVVVWVEDDPGATEVK